MSNDPNAVWAVIWRLRLAILAFAVVIAAIAYGFASLQPKVYSARATVLTPKEAAAPSLSASLGNLLGSGGGGRDGGGGGLSLPTLIGGAPSLSTNQDMFVVLLRSRSLREQVNASMVKKFGPRADGMLVTVLPDTKDKGALALTVEAKDPVLASEFANEYFEELDRMLERLTEQTTKRQELSYAAQLQRAAREVEVAEDALVKFQNENRMLGSGAGAAESKKEADVGAGMRGQIMALELQREVMAMRYTPQHPAMRDIEKQIAEMKRQYSRNLFGAPMDLPADAGGKSGRKEFFVPAEKMTPMQLNYLKLHRNLRIQEAFYTGALQGLQQIQYNNAAPSNRVDFLDRALPNPTPVRPNVRFITIGAGMLGLVIGALLSLVFEFFRQRRRLMAGGRVPRRAGAAGEAAEPMVSAR